MNATKYQNFKLIDPNEVQFALGNDNKGKATVQMFYGSNAGAVGIVSPACVTNWPRCQGDGNYGTMWGPEDPTKAKFTLDLNDVPINGNPNDDFTAFANIMEAIDDRLLAFVHTNQLKILNRKNLGMEEVKMLQIRTIKPKYDKATGGLQGHAVQMSTQKFQWDGMGSKVPRKIVVCDKDGQVLANGCVQPGDIVAATIYANMVYTGVGGDKFGIQWSFESVQVVCQRLSIALPVEIADFMTDSYSFAAPYADPTVAEPTEPMKFDQFSDEGVTAGA